LAAGSAEDADSCGHQDGDDGDDHDHFGHGECFAPGWERPVGELHCVLLRL
jgi:hypothetical protein